MKESFVHNQKGRVFKTALALLLAAMLALGSLSVPSLVWAEEADGQEQGEAAVEPEQAEATALVSGDLTPLATGTGRWIKNYGGSKSDDLYSVVQTSDGGFVAVGSSSSSNGDLSGNRGGTDFSIAKFDAGGNKLWIKNYGGSGADVFKSVIQASDGGFVAVGYSFSSGGDVPGNKGDADAIIAKFDADGNKLWIKNFGGSKGDEFNSVVHASDGGFVTVGASSSVNGDLSQNKGATDFLVAKFDASGNKVWAKSYGGSGSVAVAGDDCLNSVVQAPDGGFVAVGSSGSSDGDLPGNKGYWDFIIAKFDANGNKVWIKNYGGSSGNGDFFYSVASTTDGGFVAVGNSNSSDGDLSGDASGVGLATIAKFDTNGNKVWLRKSGGRIGLSSPFFSVAQTSDGGFVAAGSANSSDENVHPIERGYGDFIIAKFDVNGNEIWLKGYWGQGYDSFASVIQTVDGSIVAVGSSSSSGGDLPDNKGDNDFIIAKFDSDGSLDPLTRHAGDVRTETAVQASRKTFPDASQVSTVIVAFSHNFPDALAASALAGATGAPLLLSATDSLDAVTLDELKRLSPSKVYIVGGEGVISDAVLSELQALPSTPQVSRLGGGDRYTTARLIAEEALRSGAPATEVFLATGKNFPDALAVSPFAAYKKVPVLLTEPGALSPDAKAFITANNVKEITIIGGEAVVSPEVFSELESLGVGVSRLFGDERYATARAATEALITQYGMSPTLVGIATGDNFPDALAGGVALGIRGGVMVLTPTGTLNANAEAVLSALKANLPDVEIFGGTAAVASEVETAVRQTLGF